MTRRFTIWQCRDFCCSRKPFSKKWWNVGVAPGNYDSVPSWYGAVVIAQSGKLKWEP